MNDELKKCSKCGVLKPLCEFYYRKYNNTYHSSCKMCDRQQKKKYYESHKSEKQKYYLKHKNHIINYQKRNHYKYKEKAKKCSLNYYYTNVEDRLEYQRNYYYENKNQVKQYNTRYKTIKKSINPIYKKQLYLSAYLRKIFNLKGCVTTNKIYELTCLNGVDYYNYLLKTFRDRYNRDWDGVEEVNIDHKKPLSTAKTMEDLFLLQHYTNLQLLTGVDNRKKGKRY